MNKKIKADDLIKKVMCPVCHRLRSHPYDIAMIKSAGECCSCDSARSEMDDDINYQEELSCR